MNYSLFLLGISLKTTHLRTFLGTRGVFADSGTIERVAEDSGGGAGLTNGGAGQTQESWAKNILAGISICGKYEPVEISKKPYNDGDFLLFAKPECSVSENIAKPIKKCCLPSFETAHYDESSGSGPARPRDR